MTGVGSAARMGVGWQCLICHGARIVLNPQRLDWSKMLRVGTTRAPAFNLKSKLRHCQMVLEFWCRYARPTRCSLGQTALRLGSSHLVPELFQAVDYKFEYGEDIIQPLTKSLREELEKF
jgi:hypothetical protein